MSNESMILRRILESNGVESSMLDSLVDEAASREAQRVNNEGMGDQLEYLCLQGISDESILDQLGIDS